MSRLKMASKLFHAVVGVGISLGVAACGGAVTDDEGLGFSEPEAGAPGLTPEAGTSAVSDAAPAEIPDAGPMDAALVDATADAADDALVAAFCDVAWPITKSGREVCGPYEECATSEAPWCFGPGHQGSCTIYPLQCVGGQWQCMGGATPTNSAQAPVTCP
jgi:hypothetical protein